MRSVHTFSISARFLIWVGIVFLGGIAYAQGRNIDTLHVFKADTVRLSFDDVLPLSVVYDSADRDDWHYIYRWNTGERTDGIQVKFDGRRKVLYKGQRLSAIHWQGKYDTLWLNAGDAFRGDFLYYITDSKEDTVILRAPDIEGTDVRYAWSNDTYLNEERLLPDTEQYAVVYRDMWDTLGWEYGMPYFHCQVTAVSEEGETTVLHSFIPSFY